MRLPFLIISFLSIAVSASAQLGLNQWDDGYFYDASGHKIPGQIVVSPSGRSPQDSEGFILFRKDKGEEKEKLSASMIRSFVAGKDSFTVAHAPQARSQGWPGKSIDFVKVLVNEPMKLYATVGGGGGLSPGISPSFGIGGGSFGSGMGGGLGINLGGGRGGRNKSAYFYGDDANNLTELKRDDFIPIMSEIMASEPEIVEKIKNKKYKYGNMDQLVLDFYKLKEAHPQAQ